MSLCARSSARSESCRARERRHRMTEPANASISESIPKPTSAIDPAARPATSAIANSTRCQAFPPQARRRARDRSRSRRAGPGPATTRTGSATGMFLVAHMLEADLEKQPDVGVVKGVVDVPSLFPVPHQAARAKEAEIV